MLNSPRVREAFDLSKEPSWLRERYGRTTYGQGCLLARRLAEAGVKFSTCYFSNSIGGRSKSSGGWDTHGFDDTRMYPIVEAYHLPVTDQTLPTLLEDLEQRGMLDETLVVWMGEFGRTPKINKNASRDHWPNCYSVLLAGGGVKGGFVHGKSDKHAAEPAEDGVTPGAGQKPPDHHPPVGRKPRCATDAGGAHPDQLSQWRLVASALGTGLSGNAGPARCH